MPLSPQCLCVLAVAAGCAGDKEEVGPKETGEDAGETADTYVPSGPVELRLALSDLATSMPMTGPQITLGGRTATVGGAGVVVFEVEPDDAAVAVGTMSGYWPLHATFTGPREETQWSLLWPSESLLDSLSTGFGSALDASRGGALVRVWERSADGDLYHLDGGRAVWSAAPTLSLAADLSADAGWSTGDTTVDDSPAWLLFLGLPAGEVDLSLEAPAGFSCGLALSPSAEAPRPEIVAGALLAADFYCQEG